MLAFKKLCWNRITAVFSLPVQNTERYLVNFPPPQMFKKKTAEI